MYSTVIAKKERPRESRKAAKFSANAENAVAIPPLNVGPEIALVTRHILIGVKEKELGEGGC